MADAELPSDIGGVAENPITIGVVEPLDSWFIVLCVGDTTYLDYGGIKAKREGYGSTGNGGNGGNGLILHSALAVAPDQGQVVGLLWQKLWNREPKVKPPKVKPPKDETPEAKKQRLAIERKVARQRLFKDKESYRWVEAITEVEHQVSNSTRVIHIFDREGDITKDISIMSVL